MQSAMDKMALSESDVRASWRWLAHRAYTELVALHPEYRPGKENYESNKAHDAFPRTWNGRSEDDVVAFARKHHGTRMVCYGVNERPAILKNERGFARAAREEEITKTKSFVLDIDVEAKSISRVHLDALEKTLGEMDDYFGDLGLQKPVRAFTGRGYHLLFAYPEIAVSEVPDIAARQRKFADEFRDSYHKELASLEAKVDATHDLRRMVKIYGTAKPQVGIVSRFYGGERAEDGELRTYLLGMVLTEEKVANDPTAPAYGPKLLSIKDNLPDLFLALLKRDEPLQKLWAGNGKNDISDTSRSGYDFSIVRRLLALGYRDLDDIATIVALRPDGAVKGSGKDIHYVCRTIGKAVGS